MDTIQCWLAGGSGVGLAIRCFFKMPEWTLVVVERWKFNRQQRYNQKDGKFQINRLEVAATAL
jgi:hypothetical protein